MKSSFFQTSEANMNNNNINPSAHARTRAVGVGMLKNIMRNHKVT